MKISDIISLNELRMGLKDLKAPTRDFKIGIEFEIVDDNIIPFGEWVDAFSVTDNYPIEGELDFEYHVEPLLEKYDTLYGIVSYDEFNDIVENAIDMPDGSPEEIYNKAFKVAKIYYNWTDENINSQLEDLSQEDLINGINFIIPLLKTSKFKEDTFYFTNENKDDFVDLKKSWESVQDYEDLQKFSKIFIDSDDVADELSDIYMDELRSIYNAEVSDGNLKSYEDSEERAIEIFSDNDIELSTYSEDYSEWSITEDSSISPNGFEIVSPVFNYQQSLRAIKKIFNIIEANYSTNNSTGLHLNIGNFNIEDIDLMKLLVFTGQDHVLQKFGRSTNSFTANNFNILKDKLNGQTLTSKDINSLIKELNEFILTTADKYRFFNFSKLKNNHYIEVRALGGADYETKYDLVIQQLNRFLRVIEIAMDPNAYREEYLKKLSSVIDNSGEKASSNEKNKLVKSLSNTFPFNRKFKDLTYVNNLISRIAVTYGDHSELSTNQKMIIRQLFPLIKSSYEKKDNVLAELDYYKNDLTSKTYSFFKNLIDKNFS